MTAKRQYTAPRSFAITIVNEHILCQSNANPRGGVRVINEATDDWGCSNERNNNSSMWEE